MGLQKGKINLAVAGNNEFYGTLSNGRKPNRVARGQLCLFVKDLLFSCVGSRVE